MANQIYKSFEELLLPVRNAIDRIDKELLKLFIIVISQKMWKI